MQKKYKFQLTEKDHELAQKAHIAPRPIFRILILIIGALWFVSCVMSISSNGLSDKPSIILLAVGIYFFLLYFFILPYRWRSNFRKSKLLQKEQTYEFHEEGISAESEVGAGTVGWEDILKWRKREEILLVYPAPNAFYLFPKRIFESEAEIGEIDSLLTQKIGPPT